MASQKNHKRAKATKKSNKQPKLDPLTSLPDSIINQILSSLDAKFIVQTCIISKQWKDKWKSVRNINFNSANFTRLRDFDEFINTFLSRRDHTINLNRFSLSRRGRINKLFINRIFNYVVSHNVNEVSISFDRYGHLLLPTNLVTCQSIQTFEMKGFFPIFPPRILFKFPKLMTLHLSHCNFTYGGSENHVFEPFADFYNLRSLHLFRCTFDFSDFELEVLKISGSHLVELSLDNLSVLGDTRLQLATPGLKTFRFSQSSPISFIDVKNLYALKDVYIDVLFSEDLHYQEDWEIEETVLKFTSMFQPLRHTRSIILTTKSIEMLHLALMTVELSPSPFNSLVFLKFRMKSGEHKMMIDSHVVNYFLKASRHSVSLEFGHERSEHANEQIVSTTA